MKKTCIQRNLKWWQIVLSFIICHLSFSPAGAQTFTQRLQQKGQGGEGTVTVTHSKAIDELVNGKQPVEKPEKPMEKAQEKKADESPAAIALRKAERKLREMAPDTGDVRLDPADGRRKVMVGGYKITGYRVQAFAGGNQRKDRQTAERVGNTIKASYPDVPIYVHFYSPRWICRVGNFRTYEEAHEMLVNIRKLGISGASIVKGKITVQY